DTTGSQYWNAVPGCCGWHDGTVDDAGYLVGLVEEAIEKYHIDTTRVALIGHSNGGYMSHRLACDRADLFSGIASIAGTSFSDKGDCQPSEPVSVLQIHGTLDATVSYVAPFAGPGAEGVVDWWVDFNGCTGDAVASEVLDYDTAVAGSETQPSLWSDCDAGSAVELWRMEGSGHIPIFGDDFVPAALGFLLGHPKPD
ncbi:MAG: prolyl oligopeptidase family serine peptidase, partial [Myxococcota bacterium]|nr:prolyl oligopeptidase family serine peptidase [Myxococcota bacterium]